MEFDLFCPNVRLEMMEVERTTISNPVVKSRDKGMNRKNLNLEIGDNVTEEAARCVLLKKVFLVFLKISQSSQENNCA